jgi:hypothetical protein
MLCRKRYVYDESGYMCFWTRRRLTAIFSSLLMNSKNLASHHRLGEKGSHQTPFLVKKSQRRGIANQQIHPKFLAALSQPATTHEETASKLQT